MICSKFQIICIPRFQIIQILNVLKFLQMKKTFANLGTQLWPLSVAVQVARAFLSKLHLTLQNDSHECVQYFFDFIKQIKCQ